MGMAAYGKRGVTMFNARIHHTSGKFRTGLLVVAAAVSLFAATGAQAQNCNVTPTGGDTQLARQLGIIGASPASVSAMISSSLTAANTAFLLQSTAFVGAPGNPAPDQQGGGVWWRAVGGEVDIKSSTTSTASQPVTPASPAGASATINCSQKVDTTFAGAQLGADIARLNVNGWNLHFGTTVGYLGTKGRLDEGAAQLTDPFNGNLQGGGPFTSSTQVPFAGVYAAATYGGFFVDGLLRAEYYQTKLNAPGDFLFNQEIDAHGWSFSASTGYNWKPTNSNWFVEPSAGVIISRTKVDPFNYITSGSVANHTVFGETLQLNDVKSDIGRVGVRIGTTYESGGYVWAPFVAASVWHEFGPNVTANAATCPGLSPTQSCAFVNNGIVSSPTVLSASSSTSTFGTFGQYSVGVSGQLVGTGWLGFLRADYRDGENLHGISGTGGIRYQFTPEGAPVVKMPVKAPIYKAPIVEAVNWTGFYIGGFGSAELGTADWNYVTGSAQPHIGGYDVGGNVGYNWQSGRLVFGVEGALEKTNLNGGTACGPLLSGQGTPLMQGSPMFQMTCNAWANWIAEATARIGFTWDRALFYVKGGGAWTTENFSATCNLGPIQGQLPTGENCVNPARNLSNGLSASSGRGGLLVGWGTEFALTRNWSAKAETSYLSFGDKNVFASDSSPLNVGMHIWETKIGVNYRFDGGAVVARY
jgi:outer membrane autotransporter protein